MYRSWFSLCLFLCAWFSYAPKLHGQDTRLNVGGNTVYCTYPNGQPVRWYSSPTLNDVGYTMPQGILFNPNVLQKESIHLHLFWLGHECGHAHLQTEDESEADCWSAKTGVEQGWFDASDATTLAREMAKNPGDRSHPPGAARARHVKDCMQKASSDDSGDDEERQTRTGSSGQPLPPGMVRGFPPQRSPPLAKDPTPKNHDANTLCASLNKMVAASAKAFVEIQGDTRTPHSAFTTLQLPKAKECFIQTTSKPSYVCNFPKSFFKTLVDGTTACFPDTRSPYGTSITTFRLKSPGDRPSILIFLDDDIRLEMSSTR